MTAQQVALQRQANAQRQGGSSQNNIQNPVQSLSPRPAQRDFSNPQHPIGHPQNANLDFFHDFDSDIAFADRF